MIQFENVSKIYRGQDQPVLSDINMTIPNGKLTVLIGPSGCGKTTCLKMINRLVNISSGKITIDGQDIMSQDPIELRRTMGYVIQQTGLFPHLTVRENIEIIPTLQNQEKDKIRKRTLELMEMVGLDPEEFLDRYPTQLSGGQLQRVGVARAFATDPEIILMDEPFSALDPITRAQLQSELIFLQSKVQKTIVFVTHDMDEAIKLGDMICILHQGHVVQFDTPEAIMKQPADSYVAKFVGRNRIWNNPEYIRARDIMIHDPVAVPGGLPILRTMEIMRAHKVDSALILDEERHLMGVVRARDIQTCEDKNASTETLLQPPKGTASPDENIIQLLTKVQENHLSTLPILDGDGKLEGLITTSSLVTAMSQQYIPAIGEEAQS